MFSKMGCGSEKSTDVQPSEPQLVVVFGATGRQGGSVVRAMAGDKRYKLRAVTRDATKADQIKAPEVEVVQADFDDRVSLERALEGAYGVFLVTNYWESFDGQKETTQGRNVVDAAKEAKVKHLIFSGLENVKAVTGKECAHFDSKAEIEEYIKKSEIPYTFVRYSYYYENLFLFAPKKVDGSYVLEIPMGQHGLDQICVAESGECIHQIFKQFKQYKNKAIGLSSDKKTISEYAAILTRVTGKTFVATTTNTEVMSKAGFPGAGELAAMYEFYQSGKPKRDIKLTRKLNSKISSFEQWVQNNKDEISATLSDD